MRTEKYNFSKYAIIWAKKILNKEEGYSLLKAKEINPLFAEMVENEIDKLNRDESQEKEIKLVTQLLFAGYDLNVQGISAVNWMQRFEWNWKSSPFLLKDELIKSGVFDSWVMANYSTYINAIIETRELESVFYKNWDKQMENMTLEDRRAFMRSQREVEQKMWFKNDLRVNKAKINLLTSIQQTINDKRGLND